MDLSSVLPMVSAGLNGYASGGKSTPNDMDSLSKLRDLQAQMAQQSQQSQALGQASGAAAANAAHLTSPVASPATAPMAPTFQPGPDAYAQLLKMRGGF